MAHSVTASDSADSGFVAKRRGHGHPWLALLAVSLGLMMVMLDATVVAIANPAIGLDLDASLSDLQWVTNAYLLAVAVLIITAGKAGDRFGRKRIFLTGVVGFALASAACGFAPSIEALIAFRTVQGFAGALLMPSTLAIIRVAFPERLLQQAIGIWAGVSMAAVASGPIVAGARGRASELALGLLSQRAGCIRRRLRRGWVIAESRDEKAVEEAFRPDRNGGVVRLVVCARLGHHQEPRPRLGRRTVVSSLAASAVGFFLFALREREAEYPLLPLRLFRKLSLSVGVVFMLMLAFALFGIVFFLSLYLQRVRGYTPVETGVRTLPLTATLVIAAPLGGCRRTPGTAYPARGRHDDGRHRHARSLEAGRLDRLRRHLALVGRTRCGTRYLAGGGHADDSR